MSKYFLVAIIIIAILARLTFSLIQKIKTGSKEESQPQSLSDAECRRNYDQLRELFDKVANELILLRFKID